MEVFIVIFVFATIVIPFFINPIVLTCDAVSRIISRIIRYRNLTKRLRPYMSKNNGSTTLKNSNVIFIYNAKKHSISCIDCKIRNHTAVAMYYNEVADYIHTLETNYESILMRANFYDDDFVQTYNDVCKIFSDTTTYAYIVDILIKRLIVEEYDPITKETKILSKNMYNNLNNPTWYDASSMDKYKDDSSAAQEDIFVPDNQKLDINTASEDEITNLPGISVVMAKRIIKYRDKNGGIKSLSEFFKEFKIKEHFKKQLSQLITVKRNFNDEVKTNVEKPIKKHSDERIIDF